MTKPMYPVLVPVSTAITFPLRLVPIAEDIREPYDGPVCWYCSQPLPPDDSSVEDPFTGAVYCSDRCVINAMNEGL